MCPRQSLDNAPCDMSLGSFKRIVDEVKGAVEFVDLSSRGESLLNKDVFAMIAYAHAQGIGTSLPTNGMLLDEDARMRLVRSGLDLLTVSVDAHSPGTYGKIRPGGCFQHVVENVHRMVELDRRMRGRMTIIVQMVAMAENEHELRDFKAYWKSFGVATKIKSFSNRSGLVKCGDAPLTGRAVARCSRVWRGMRVYADGTVVPCCNDFLGQMPLGDLVTQTIGQIWNGIPMAGIRERHAAGADALPLACQSCEFSRIDFYKQTASFAIDDLTMRRSLVLFGLKAR
jgi:MoaA/NifB/PqqE/SkfB family radical SAM enzyme